MTLDFIGGTFLTAVIVVNLVALFSALEIGRLPKLVIVGVVGLWIGLQTSLAGAGALSSEAALFFPLVGLMVVLPLVIVALAASTFPSVRGALLGLPLELLVGLNIFRVLGVFFLLLAADGRLGGPFPQSAGWGDIATGIFGLPLAYLAARRIAKRAMHLWNLFGFTDLILAVVLGTLSFSGSVFHVIKAEPGSNAVLLLPWSLIPTVLVPFYLIVHGIIFAQLRGQTAEAPPKPLRA